VIRRHCRDLLGLTFKDLPHDDDGDDGDDGKPIAPHIMEHARSVLAKLEIGKVHRLTICVLKALCSENAVSLPARGHTGKRSKKQLVHALLVRTFFALICLYPLMTFIVGVIFLVTR